MKDSKIKLHYILIFALAAYIIKNIFVGADNDEAYGIVAGYRLALGDKMFLEMWEPHQTSAIFTAFFIKLFLLISRGSVDYLNIYLRIIYFLIHGLISYGVYRTFRLPNFEMRNEDAKWLSLIFFVSSPKCIYIPEYSNLHIWFFTLFCLSVVWYYYGEALLFKNPIMLVLSGLFLSCDVLAYPSMVLLFPVFIIFMCVKRDKKLYKEILLFSLPCLVGAFLLIGYVLSYMSIEQLFEVMPYVMGDGSHAVSLREKILGVMTSCGEMAIILLVAFVISGLLVAGYCLWKRKSQIKKDVKVSFILLTFGVLSIHQIICYFTSEYNASFPHVIYLYICVVGMYFYFKNKSRNQLGISLILFSFVSYIGIIILSNWDPIHLMPYLIVGVLGGFVYWKDYLVSCLKVGEKVFRTLCGIIVFMNIWGYCYLIIGGVEINSSIFQVGGYCKEGLRAGIFAEYMNAYIYNENQKVWPEAIPAGSSVMYVGQTQTFYMQGDCTISAANTISTPIYDERLLKYWEINPDRYPDVVVVECMYDSISVGEDNYMMRWLQEEFHASEVTHYPYIIVYKK